MINTTLKGACRRLVKLKVGKFSSERSEDNCHQGQRHACNYRADYSNDVKHPIVLVCVSEDSL